MLWPKLLWDPGYKVVVAAVRVNMHGVWVIDDPVQRREVAPQHINHVSCEELQHTHLALGRQEHQVWIHGRRDSHPHAPLALMGEAAIVDVLLLPC